MGAFPGPVIEPMITIHPWSEESIGLNLMSMGLPMSGMISSGWGTNNVAVHIPFYVYVPTTIVKISWINGSAVAGNVDAGIYSAEGNRIVSGGAVGQSGISVVQTLDITDTTLTPGLYFMALSCSLSTATVLQQQPPVGGGTSSLGILNDTAGHPLPATATWTKPGAGAGLVIPGLFLSTRTVV